MGLDPKEKNLLKFLAAITLPPALALLYAQRRFFPASPMELAGYCFTAYYVLWRMLLQPLLLKLRTALFPKKLAEYGRWALVTGGTSGIGEAFCHRLAERGLNVLIVSRSKDKLERVCKEVGEKHGVETDWMAYDFGTGDEKVRPGGGAARERGGRRGVRGEREEAGARRRARAQGGGRRDEARLPSFLALSRAPPHPLPDPPQVTEKFYKDLDKKIESLSGGVGMLINNVGLANEDAEYERRERAERLFSGSAVPASSSPP